MEEALRVIYFLFFVRVVWYFWERRKLLEPCGWVCREVGGRGAITENGGQEEGSKPTVLVVR